MKLCKLFPTLILCCFLSMLILSESKAQTYTGNLNLTTQAEVNAFNYTEVTGNLYIYGTDITDLSPLSNLVSVGGQLGIVDNTSLTTINGFSSLTTAGEILIDENPVLQSFSDFHSLVSTLAGGNIEIYHNVSLTSFSGFEVLQTVGWSFEISYNTFLTQIPAYPLLHTIASSFFIYNNPLLPEITGFKALQSVGYSFIITDNNALAEFCGLYNFFNYNNGVYYGTGTFDISGNLVNPSIQDIINGGPCPAPEDLIYDLQSSVVGLGLPKGLENSLTSSLNNAKNSLQNGNNGAAINKLEAFISKVEAQSGKKIDETDADDLIASAQAIIDAIQSSLSKSSNEQTITSSDINPGSFSLDQNYPNPFNPSTVISYAVPEDARVTLVIYDALGKQIAELVNGDVTAGNHEVTFNGSELASGIYFYRMTTGTFSQINKMLLLK